MKKRGFTLIELLGVIIVLAIIALIATPIVMNTIENNRRETAELGMHSVQEAAELYYYNNHLTGGVINSLVFQCGNGACSNGNDTLKINGKIPDDGIIKIDKKGNVIMKSMVIDGYFCQENGGTFNCAKSKSETWTSRDTITLYNDLSSDLVHYKIYGRSVQPHVEGVVSPNPDSPQEIESVGDLVTDKNNINYGKYEIPIRVMSKNLFDESKLLENGFVLLEDGSYYSQDASEVKDKQLFKNEDNIDETLAITFYIKYSSTNKGSGLFPVIYYTDDSYYSFHESPEIGHNPTEYMKVSFTTDPAKTVDYITWSYVGEDTTTYIKDMQIQVGQQATDYEPYKNPIITSIYLDEPLRCAGDTNCDYVDFALGKVVRNINTITLDGGETWSTDGSTGKYYRYYYRLTGQKSGFPALSTHFQYLYNYATDTPHFFTSSLLYVFSDRQNLSSFKSWLSTHNVTFYYHLATPIEEMVELPSVKLFDGYNRIEVDTKVRPTQVQFKYYNRAD